MTPLPAPQNETMVYEDQNRIDDWTKNNENNQDSVQNEETVQTSFENNPCRKIFAFSVSKSKEVYF